MTVPLSPKHVEIIKILATSDGAVTLGQIRDMAGHKSYNDVETILRQYYHENTRGAQTVWTDQLLKAGIDEDAGKAAVAHARRLGMDIS